MLTFIAWCPLNVHTYLTKPAALTACLFKYVLTFCGHQVLKGQMFIYRYWKKIVFFVRKAAVIQHVHLSVN